MRVLPIYKLKWVKERELKALGNDTRECTLSVAGAVAKPTTFKTADAVTADSPMRKSESIIGHRRPLRDRDRVSGK